VPVAVGVDQAAIQAADLALRPEQERPRPRIASPDRTYPGECAPIGTL
jgi:hypothetical protein